MSLLVPDVTIPAEIRPTRADTGLTAAERHILEVTYGDRLMVTFDLNTLCGTFHRYEFDKLEFIALCHAFLSRAVCAGLAAEAVAIEDVLFQWDMMLTKKRAETVAPW